MPSDVLRLFADDNGLFIHGPNLINLMISAQSLLRKLEKWFYANKLTLSVPKCEYTIFRGRNKKIPNNIPILTMNDIEITRVEYIKYIGLMLDSKFTWKQHVDSIC